jgi:hypothetical protein
MRLYVNEQAQRELVEMMNARGKHSPSYFINLLITEAYKQHLEIPIPEGSNGKPATHYAT